MSKAPTKCRYCDGKGNGAAGGTCGFCDHGVPLDTQADWDASWGELLAPSIVRDPDSKSGECLFGMHRKCVVLTCGCDCHE